MNGSNCPLDSFKGEYVVIYRNGQGTSPALDWYAEQTGKNWKLTVDYANPISAQYYGSVEPPERSYEEQISDWQNGYMWGRFQVNENCEKDPYGGYYYWVQYPAVLEEDTAVVDAWRYILAALIIGVAVYFLFKSLSKEGSS